MSEKYTRDILRRNVAQICLAAGWKGITSTPLDILTNVLEKHVIKLGKQTNRYAEQFNRTEPNLNDLGLVFRDHQIQLTELAEYTQHIIPPPVRTVQFPKHKESNLNFLSPGSLEATTRPMHVYEHLPPMYPEKEPAAASTFVSNISYATPGTSVTDSHEDKNIFKRPLEPVSLPKTKKPQLQLDKGKTIRESSSVTMTLSGFVLPVREGKLPGACIPEFISENHHDSPEDKSHHPNAANVPLLEKDHKRSKKKKFSYGKVKKIKKKGKTHKGKCSKSKNSSRVPESALKTK